jgi:hypothetical protein
LGQSLKNEFPVVRCGSRTEDRGKFKSVTAANGSGSILSANSVSLKNQLNFWVSKLNNYCLEFLCLEKLLKCGSGEVMAAIKFNCPF